MAWGASDLNAVYDFPIVAVYNAVIYAAQSIKYKIKSADPNTHTIVIDVGMSLLTWGERMTVNLYQIEGGRTSVIFNSKSNLGTEIAANSKNKKNIEKLVNAIPQFLQQPQQ